MRVDGREIAVSGSLLQPLTRRTNDILRLALSALFLIVVVTSSLITRYEWDALERSVSQIIAVLTPTQSNLVYLAYGAAILVLPFVILVGLVVERRWRPLGAFAAAGLLAVLALSITGNGIDAPRWRLDWSDRFDTQLSQFLDDPRWIAMLAAVLTVSGPWVKERRRRWWWALLLAFVPIHLVVSAVLPARSLLGLAVGWFVGALVVLVVGTPALEVPLEGAVRALDRRGFRATALTVLRPAGRGPLVLTAVTETPGTVATVHMYGPNQRSGGALRQIWHKLRLRPGETAPLQASMRRAVEHRALMMIAVGELGLSNTSTVAVATLERGWALYAHTPVRGVPIDECADQTPLSRVWEGLRTLHDHTVSHGDLRPSEVTVDEGSVLFGGFSNSEYGATDAQLQSDIAQLLVTTSAAYGAEQAVEAAIEAFGADTVLTASRRLTKHAVPARVRESVADANTVIEAAREEVMRQTGADRIRAESVTRFTRTQVIQIVLLGALVYVAYPFLSSVSTFSNELRNVIWWWALVGLAVSVLKYFGAATALWACADGLVKFGQLTLMQVANTFAATTTPAGVGGLALSTRYLQKNGLGAVRATTAVALQQSVQVGTHIVLLIGFSTIAGAQADLSRFIPSATVVYIIVGAVLGLIGIGVLVPKLRRWLLTTVRPRLVEVLTDFATLARQPQRLVLVVIGCATTTLGSALALWASLEAFGGEPSFVTITVVTMVGGSLASAAPTPGGVGAVEAALIGGLAAFGVPAGIAVPGVLLYRVLTCWLPVLIGWRLLGWMTKRELI